MFDIHDFQADVPLLKDKQRGNMRLDDVNLENHVVKYQLK